MFRALCAHHQEVNNVLYSIWYHHITFLYMFRALCAHHQEVKNVLDSIWYHHITFLYMFRALLCSSSGGQKCIIQHLVSSHYIPLHVSSTIVLIIRRLKMYYTASGIITLHSSTCFQHYCAHHQEVKNVLYIICYHQTCRWPSGAQV